MLVHTKMVRSKEKGVSSGVMAHGKMANLRTITLRVPYCSIYQKEMESMPGQITVDSKAIGLTIKCMAKDVHLARWEIIYRY
jgi:hypothetical protein